MVRGIAHGSMDGFQLSGSFEHRVLPREQTDVFFAHLAIVLHAVADAVLELEVGLVPEHQQTLRGVEECPVVEVKVEERWVRQLKEGFLD